MGVKCIIRNGDKILFVRLGYSHKVWTIPGGRVDKNETPEQTVRREVKEEVGITLGDIEMIGEYVSTREYKIDTVKCFQAWVDSFDFKIDNIEIIEAKWCIIDNLPTPHGPRLKQQLSYLNNN